jgi:AsmA protein
MKRHWIKIALALAVLLVIIIALIPLFVNADTFRPVLEGQISAALGRKITLGHLSFSVLSDSLVADNVSVADDPAFGAAPFLQAKSLHIGVEAGPLLFHRQVRITNFSADSPSINLIHAQNGTWNFSSLGRGAASHTGNMQQESTIPNLTVGEVTIKNGMTSVSTLPTTGKPLVYSNLNLSIQQFSFAKSFPFKLSASLPGDGSLELSGTAGPVSQKDASDTPFNAAVQLKHLDPVAAGVLDQSQGISMLADVSAQLVSNGATLTSNGKIHADRLQLVRTGTPAPRAIDINYAIADNLEARTGQITDLAINTGSVAVHVTGSYRRTAQVAMLDLRLSAANLPIDQFEQLLPAFGVRLPSGSTLQGGTLTSDLTIAGPANATDITGTAEINNTRLTGFDLGSKIQGLKAVNATAGGTVIQTVRANINSSPQLTEFTNIYGSVPQLGTATGSGMVFPSGAINFHLVAKLNASTGAGALASGAIGGMLGNVIHTAATNGIPVNITGTATNPSIQADLNSIVKQQAGGLLGNAGGKQPNPASLARKLFGKH